ncbi:hypothetical protein EDEG_01774 [Edhazardia aedis USNM 41457]|uniref:Uncharacterized protein n=1 Tax=Edhazardia aedis (strain USNM 41457) TaxID=1003232 RepID=J9D820_EDHAE|nr:hypothetical protein EDEG_01774 [Edhazardia aedis USNM 41457]|eukprot:EJW03936.1 hypothetical protein EDEG_01774 [Edhazardia aedis USNM 41457]
MKRNLWLIFLCLGNIFSNKSDGESDSGDDWLHNPLSPPTNLTKNCISHFFMRLFIKKRADSIISDSESWQFSFGNVPESNRDSEPSNAANLIKSNGFENHIYEEVNEICAQVSDNGREARAQCSNRLQVNPSTEHPFPPICGKMKKGEFECLSQTHSAKGELFNKSKLPKNAQSQPLSEKLYDKKTVDASGNQITSIDAASVETKKKPYTVQNSDQTHVINNIHKGTSTKVPQKIYSIDNTGFSHKNRENFESACDNNDQCNRVRDQRESRDNLRNFCHAKSGKKYVPTLPDRQINEFDDRAAKIKVLMWLNSCENQRQHENDMRNANRLPNQPVNEAKFNKTQISCSKPIIAQISSVCTEVRTSTFVQARDIPPSHVNNNFRSIKNSVNHSFKQKSHQYKGNTSINVKIPPRIPPRNTKKTHESQIAQFTHSNHVITNFSSINKNFNHGFKQKSHQYKGNTSINEEIPPRIPPRNTKKTHEFQVAQFTHSNHVNNNFSSINNSVNHDNKQYFKQMSRLDNIKDHVASNKPPLPPQRTNNSNSNKTIEQNGHLKFPLPKKMESNERRQCNEIQRRIRKKKR